jgi:hypothetical protein
MKTASIDNIIKQYDDAGKLSQTDILSGTVMEYTKKISYESLSVIVGDSNVTLDYQGLTPKAVVIRNEGDAELVVKGATADTIATLAKGGVVTISNSSVGALRVSTSSALAVKYSVHIYVA